MTAAQASAGDGPDWTALAVACGLWSPDTPLMKRGGDSVAKDALIRLVGEDVLTDAAQEYLANGKGSELAVSVLRLLRPECATAWCLDQFDLALEQRNAGRQDDLVEALRLISHPVVVPWIEIFLKEPRHQAWAIEMMYDHADRIELAHLEHLVALAQPWAQYAESTMGHGEDDPVPTSLMFLREIEADLADRRACGD